jgi:molecular chaperone DnaK
MEWDAHSKAGKGEVQIMADSDGRRTIPSVVGYTSNTEPVVGAVAKAQASINPTNTM